MKQKYKTGGQSNPSLQYHFDCKISGCQKIMLDSQRQTLTLGPRSLPLGIDLPSLSSASHWASMSSISSSCNNVTHSSELCQVAMHPKLPILVHRLISDYNTKDV